MDRRAIIAVVIFSTLFLTINWYFENQNQQAMKEWKEQVEAQKEQKRRELESGLNTKTAKVEDLPVDTIDGVVGVKVKDNFITFSEKEAVGPFKKTFSNDYITLYSQNEAKPVEIANLPDFGKYDLQLFFPESQRVVWGQYEDGQFSIPIESLGEKVQGKAIVLFQQNKTYLPVAIFDSAKSSLVWLDEIRGLKTVFLTRPDFKTTEKGQEKFYVLQNAYQQLVFSNHGGALAEINLPFQDKQDEKSVVREIEFDREMVKQEPQNAYFPAHGYQSADGAVHERGQLGGYYPLIRRDLIQKSDKKSIKVPPKYYALNIVSDFPEVAEAEYKVTKFTKNEIVFETEMGSRKITKRFSIADENTGGPYTLDLEIDIEGDNRNLWLTSGIPEVEWISGGPAPSLKYRITKNNQAVVENIDLPTDTFTVTSTKPDWIVNSNGFLGVLLDPLKSAGDGFRAVIVPGNVIPSRLVEIDEQYNRFPAANMPGYMTLLPLKAGNSNSHFRVFAGPFATDIMKKVDETFSDAATGYNPDYIASQTFHGWFSFISEPFAKFLLILMKFFYWITHSWALSIILLTVALRVMLYPLNAWSIKSTLAMQKIAPEVTAIQEKYKKDPKKAQLEIVNLYREKGVNPLSGCLPLLIQLPFLIGMFDLLKSTFELRGASFIPGWIDDLAAPDVLFSWNYYIPFIGNEFHLLPILLGLVMFFQQRMMSPAARDPSEMTDQQRQQRAMGTMMTVLFTFMFYHFPSGLNIYWLSSMLLGMLQQWWMGRNQKTVLVKK